MMKNKKRIYFILAFLLFFLGIQFFPVWLPTSKEGSVQNDFLVSEQASDTIRNLFHTACYDCHSCQVTYPWYSYVAPFRWMIAHHVMEGRQELHFSEWSAYTTKEKEHQLRDIIKVIQRNEMPLWSYTFLHAHARLSVSQKEQILLFCTQRLSSTTSQ